MDLGLEGRVALVMGSSAGIGLGIAEALGREGVRVAVVSRSQERAEDAAASVAGVNVGIPTAEGAGGAAPFVADTDDLDRLVELPAEVEAALGPVDILVTNTGGPPLGKALSHELDHWERAYRSLVLAPRMLAGVVVVGMRERGWGRIVNVGSTSTREPIPGLTLSNAHRMAAVGFFKTLSREVAAEGITVNTVATGRFATERIASNYGSMEAAEAAAQRDVPAGRLGRAEEYGDLVAFLCSERAAYITGTVIPIDGGILHSAF
jgi:3-oxoacyl-[acyl-carrier protein] reductase